MSILHFRNGKVIQDWAVWDTLGLLRQLGVIPATVMGQAAVVQEDAGWLGGAVDR